MARIPLLARDGSVRAVTVVDDEDYELLSQWTWRLSTGKRGGYAIRTEGDRTVRRRRERPGLHRRTVRLHRVLLDLPHNDPREGDHKNRDRLDNRRSNLRILTHEENMQNRAARRSTRSGVRGVSFHSKSGRWSVRVQVSKTTHFVGLYDTIPDAEAAAVAARKRLSPFATD